MAVDSPDRTNVILPAAGPCRSTASAGDKKPIGFRARVLAQPDDRRRPPFRRNLVVKEAAQPLEYSLAGIHERDFVLHAEILLPKLQTERFAQYLQIFRGVRCLLGHGRERKDTQQNCCEQAMHMSSSGARVSRGDTIPIAALWIGPSSAGNSSIWAGADLIHGVSFMLSRHYTVSGIA